MSSLYVRNLVRSWAVTAAAPMPFYDTVNREVNPVDERWCTVQFLGGTNEQYTYCGQQEAGSFDLMFFARGGAGDESLLQDAEAAVAAFMASTDATRVLQLRLAGPPEDFPAGGGVPWYVVSFPVSYLYVH